MSITDKVANLVLEYVGKTGITPNSIVLTKSAAHVLELALLEEYGVRFIGGIVPDEFMGMRLVVLDEEPVVAYLAQV